MNNQRRPVTYFGKECGMQRELPGRHQTQERSMTRELAIALVKAFAADAKIERISPDLLNELWESGYAAYKWRVQAWMARVARPAADLCWDKRYKSAVKWLCTHPLEGFSTRYENEAIGTPRKYEQRYERDRKALDDLFASYRRSNQWSMCK